MLYFQVLIFFWTILNNQPVIDALNKLNGRGMATCTSCFDFSTLNTKIPYEKLLKALNELIAFSFKTGEREIISAAGHNAKWGKEKRSRVVVFNKNTSKKDTKYFLQNCYFKVGNKIFRQIIGITLLYWIPCKHFLLIYFNTY